MTFGEAIEKVKQGECAWRDGWNGKNQHIELGTAFSYRKPNGAIVNADHADIGNSAIVFVGTRGSQVGWLASQADMLADDWRTGTPEDGKRPVAVLD